MLKIMYLIIFFVAFATFSAESRANVAPIAKQSLSKLSVDMTGIYRLAYLKSAGIDKETLALVHNGQIVEVHTRTVGQLAYLKRKVYKRPTNHVDLKGDIFDKLIEISGGINKNVTKLPPAIQQDFLATAELATAELENGTNKPLTVPSPESGRCPAEYELYISFKDGRKKIECRIKADLPNNLYKQMLTWWENFNLIAPAYAYIEWRWRVKQAVEFWNWGFRHDNNWGGTGVSGWEFNGFGFEVLYLDMPDQSGG